MKQVFIRRARSRNGSTAFPSTASSGTGSALLRQEIPVDSLRVSPLPSSSGTIFLTGFPSSPFRHVSR